MRNSLHCESHTMTTQAYYAILSSILLFSSFAKTFGATIMNGPTTVSAQPGQWANFTCTVSCSHDIDWYVEGYPTDITEMCTDTFSDMMVCTTTTQECSTETSTSGLSKQLSLLAKNELAASKIAVQCAAISRTFNPDDDCSPYVVYSRFAFLNVGSLPTPEPTPVVCPSASVAPETVTVTETETVISRLIITPSPSVKTQIVTVPTTAVVTVTVNGPDCTPEAHNDISGVRRTHLSSVLRELFTWLCTILTGLAFL